MKKPPAGKGAYDPSKIEKKWQKQWASKKLYASKESASKKKYYVLDMFPYPSGEGLHVGHPKGYIATDVVSRMKRMQGMNVLHPMGFDAFGLPAENYALKTKTHPEIAVAKNVARFKEQLEKIGLDYDWSREVNTTDPAYYKWTQWIFLQLWKKGLAYESFEPINWCPSCKTGLANEDVEDGRCERCGTPVEKKPLRQWVLRITDYADKLLTDLDAKLLTNGDILETFPTGELGIFQQSEAVPGKVRSDKPFVKRNAICAFVEHWEGGRFAILKWKKVPWMTPVTGGIEGTQTAEEAARREILEETGFKNLELVRTADKKVYSTFFHVPKDENRTANFTVFHFKLKNGERESLSQEENENHEVTWVDRSKVLETLNAEALKIAWCSLEGIAYGTDAKPLLDWPESIKELQRNWIGRSEGAEIEFDLTIEKRKPRFVVLHGYKESPNGQFFPWFKSVMEKRGHEVQMPELPNSADPKEDEQVDYVLKHCTIDENTVLVGHSLGGTLAMKVLMRLNKPISGLLIVAAAHDPNFGTTWKPRSFHKTFSWNIDYERINKLAQGKVAVLSDTREENRAPYLRHLAHELKAGLIETQSVEKHFTAAQEPAVVACCTPSVKVFTTRPDTIFGVTYLVLSPEHFWVPEFKDRIENWAEVEAYMNRAKNETTIERTDATKEKTGVELKGIKAVNPATGEEVPVWIADYVLADYGTGAVMAVPAHDERDYEFAKKYNLPIKQVIAPEFGIKRPNEEFRDGSCAVVFDPATQKYAVTEDDKGFYRLCSGGNDAGESYEECARREVVEESGLYDFKSIDLIGEMIAHYPNKGKNVNRIAHSNTYVIVLNSAKVQEVKHEDHEKTFRLKWVSPSEAIDMWNALPTKGADHYTWILEQAVGMLIERGIDKTSDPKRFKCTPVLSAGKLVNSGAFNGRDSESVMKEITAFAGGRWVAKYKLRDWVFSRQRYWGEPIPLIHCDKCGVVPVPEKDLPVKLPKVKSYEPTGTGESPLAAIDKWVNVKCSKCGGKGKRETNTMPQWAGSCWYYLRYEDPNNKRAFVDPKKEKYWSPVDLYVGGAEHATRHLIYARFWHKFLYDIEAVSTIEPFTKLQSVGLIMGEDGRKMSKRFGNVVNPDDVIATYGADTLRVYEMFMGPFDQQIAWSTQSMVGARRFVERVWKLADKVSADGAPARAIHKTIKKVTEDIVGLRFNTAISALMICVNELEKIPAVRRGDYEALLKVLAPFAPHVTEELWTALGNKKSIHISEWPAYDPALVQEAEATIMFQVNGKVRGSFTAPRDATKDTLETMAKSLPEAKKWLNDKDIKRVIVVPGKLVNIVI